MIIPLKLKSKGKISIELLSGDKISLPLYHVFLEKWLGKLPKFDFGKKPFIDYGGEPIFAELAILKLFIDSGWGGVWVETYGGTHFLKSMPNNWKLKRDNISIPKDKENLLKNIWKIGKTTACFDILVWRGNDILFCESKHRGKDKLTNAQIKFIEGSLLCGIKESSLFIVEWDYASK